MTTAAGRRRRAADLAERGQPFGVEASRAKYFASEAAVRVVNLAVQGPGGYGYIDEYPVQKYLRDARVMTLYEGTSQFRRLIIGRAETGISASVRESARPRGTLRDLHAPAVNNAPWKDGTGVGWPRGGVCGAGRIARA